MRSTGTSCYLQYKSGIQIRLLSTSESVGFEIAHYDSTTLRVTGLLGQFIARQLALSPAGDSLIDNQGGNIPVSRFEYTPAKYCLFTDDYTMKLLGKRYYDYIY